MVVMGATGARARGNSMRFGFPVVAVLALAACNPSVPDSGAKQSYGDYLKHADSQTQGAPMNGTAQVGDVAPSADTAISGSALGSSMGGLSADRPRGDAPAGIKDVHSELEFADNRAMISKEQNFDAVKSVRTIQQDKALLEQQRAQYQVIAPQPLPARPSSDGPNLAAYALSTTNSVGQKMYSRSAFDLKSEMQRNCAYYTSSDLAQEAFLKSGGPTRDPKGLDPDGDGFACYWDPAPFRAAAGH